MDSLNIKCEGLRIVIEDAEGWVECWIVTVADNQTLVYEPLNIYPDEPIPLKGMAWGPTLISDGEKFEILKEGD